MHRSIDAVHEFAHDLHLCLPRQLLPGWRKVDGAGAAMWGRVAEQRCLVGADWLRGK